MAIASMTGFARAEGQFENYSWTWEAKSVNHRGLDIRCRLPNGYDHLDPIVRKGLERRVKRGSFQVALQLKRQAGLGGWRINSDVVEQILSASGQLRDRNDVAAPRMDGLLALPGVLEQAEPDEAAATAREAAMRDTLETALDALIEARRDEGARLGSIVATHLDTIERLSVEAEGAAAAQPEAIRERVSAQLAELLAAAPPLPEERLAQEIAVLANKADVREELDRLKAHGAAARELLDKPEPIGRRLDFLCQEFAREANTLCAKSVDMALTQTGLALKSSIDQLREQVQNIE